MGLTAFGSSAARAKDAAPLLASVFQDHVVLQRDRPIAVFGQAGPGQTVSVGIDDKATTATADASGAWHATLPALPAGGPHVLTAVTAVARETLSDVVMGDVFLCSGQSNMELPVSRTLNSGWEVSRADDSNIRLLTVAKATAAAPRPEFETRPVWRAATPQTVADFSAACWYFARDLEQTVKAPIGLIHASWGGSRIETWMGEDGLERAGGFHDTLGTLSIYARDPASGVEAQAKNWQAWWTARAGVASMPWRPETDLRDWRPAPEPLRDWKAWGEPELANHNGMLWFRREVTLTAAQAALPADLSLGAIQEEDFTWVNGKAVGASFGWGADRTYAIAPRVLHAGKNVIVVNVLSAGWGGPGLQGPTEKMVLRFKDGGSMSLGGQWIWKFVPETYGAPPSPSWSPIVGPSATYNAMIAPLGSFGLKGVLWYQGEANADAPGTYQGLLTNLMGDWRRRFGSDLPFLIVQLPNFGPAPTQPAASNWADVREAQRRAVAADPRAALAVAIDVGMNDELHPPNKQEVGKRLSRAARSLIYGEAISPSGPQPISARREGAEVRVTFKGDEHGLVSYSGAPHGFELCGQDQASCRFVEAHIDGDAVLLAAPEGLEPKRVRYCWGDGPVCTLYEGAGLPAGPFEIAIT
ncbi:sialate O-acetylesterase [Phenylobacterium montanum]|uniref:Sialate O-acetylesterase n=1 Tax=Phenylobacterium montanum TaxID=2823693 RepID=A0A975G391_9CAUL|nr:sialate O-acetylesterase [Caulobacter sp. S6]QUD90328.1 sialate O-acetylesterase [Caulobacter sp. S6]